MKWAPGVLNQAEILGKDDEITKRGDELNLRVQRLKDDF